MAELDIARTFLREVPRRLADDLVPSPFGVGAFVRSLPRVYWLNQLSVDADVHADAAELVAEADRLHEPVGVTHRKVEINHDLGYTVEDDFRGEGWNVARHLVMTHERDAQLVDMPADEVTPEEIAPVWADGIRESPYGKDEDVVRQLVEAQHRRRRAVRVRYFAIRADGAIASYCELFSDGETAQVESVMTLERFRGRGLAKAVVSHAVREARGAGHSLVFLVADDEDWPKELYGRLGFEPRGHVWELIREPT